MSQDKEQQKKHERETAEYKNFMSIAKRVRALEHGKWTIMPDMTDPLRKFTLDRDIGWCTIKFSLYMKQTYHRGVWDDNRWDYRGEINISGMHRAYSYDKWKNTKTYQDLSAKTGIRVRPRLARSLIEYVNQQVIPRFYQDIEEERVRHDKVKQDRIDFLAEIAKVKGLKEGKRVDNYYEPTAILEGCPLELRLQKEYIEVKGRLTYDQLARIATQTGWGK